MAPTSAEHSPLYSTYARVNLRFERGEGVWIYTDDGRRFMDLSGGIAVNALGHAHPHLVEVLKSQAEKLWHTSNLFEIPGQRRLAERLVEATFADRVFFTNSGAEALEASIKTARRYHYVEGRPERYRLITFEGAFHGRTLATIAAGGQAKYLEGFGPKVDGFDQVPFGDIAAVEAAVTEATAGILIEPIQGEGGIRAASPEFMRALRDLCDRHGLLMVLDEVQTGMGRTGRLFAHEASGVTPDIMAVAKGIGAGFPLGACLATEDAARGMTPGTHGTTYGGNPLAMAVGNGVLDVVLADGFLEHVRDVSLLFKQSLASLKDRYPEIIEDVRGEGLLLGIKPKLGNAAFAAALRDQGVLTALAGENVVRLLPPLIIKADEVREATGRIEAAAASLSSETERQVG
ncbi:aspartate aminotransferase family protein [Consotaella aegiceratis]|uniref:aspartate aminotransferase family protein n=1 Tax=Consotaella aegiceratis TaxID=3097961 RepID=UPI002F42FDFB